MSTLTPTIKSLDREGREAVLLHLAAAAISAPSGDNTQPWRFTIDAGANALTVAVDQTRDRSPMNAGQRMARLALGAAVKNICRTAELNFGTGSAQLISGENAVTIKLLKSHRLVDLKVDPLTEQRATNRRVYDGLPIRGDLQHQLVTGLPCGSGTAVRWAFDRPAIGELAKLIGVADATMFANRAILRAFLANVRFDAADAKLVEEGLSIASLELGRRESKAMNMLKRMPGVLLRLIAPSFKQRAQKLIESSSGLCFGVSLDNDPKSDIDAGRTMQSVWLQLTHLGLAVQPMMSLPVLESVQHYEPHCYFRQRSSERIAILSEKMKDYLKIAPEQRICFILRFGFALPPSGRSGRRPLHKFYVPRSEKR